MRTFEKGVEAETLGCGTGVVAVALTHNTLIQGTDKHLGISIQMKGGSFQVRALRTPGGDYKDIYLRGPARRVFAGEIRV
jgi:diaminopimelate epimerase